MHTNGDARAIVLCTNEVYSGGNSSLVERFRPDILHKNNLARSDVYRFQVSSLSSGNIVKYKNDTLGDI